jgi:ketosteroid isomerase-like protein
MQKKNGVNLMFFVFIVVSILIISCTKNTNFSEQGVLIKADADFSSMSEREGMQKAFLGFIADSGVILRNNSYPLKGKRALAGLYSSGNDTSFILTWEPLFEKISESGDLGYTYGVFTSRTRSTGDVQRGTYVTIWEKQPDGKWKFLLDTGTQGLPEQSE